MMNSVSVLIAILVLFGLVLFVLLRKKNDTYDPFIDLKLETIDHPVYGKIQCFANGDLVCKHILDGKVWEEGLFKTAFEPFIEPNTVIIDCGAYIGSHTILMHQLDRNNQILAFEMMPVHYNILRNNIQLNRLKDTLAFNVAVGQEIGSTPLPDKDYDPTKSDTNYGNTELSNQTKNPVHIPMVTLDSMRPWMKGRVSFVKIDVEGHELAVLAGALGLIRDNRPIIQIEIWGEKREEFKQSPVWKTLSLNLRYRVFNVEGMDNLLVPEEKVSNAFRHIASLKEL
jgi:FkbM family methyltransferase